MPSGTSGNIHGLVDHLFRREAGRMVAGLTRLFGPAHLQLAEEVVQESMLRAMRRWPFHGLPDDPAGWLYTVARNLALDRLRRDRSFDEKKSEILATWTPATQDSVTDDQLRLVFLCCHPDLSPDARVALTLKTVCGFGVDEIARSFLARQTTIAQRLVRAKRRIRELEIPFEVPSPDDLPARLDGVLEVLYLVFNEGYSAHSGDSLVRSDLCDEALRWTEQLARMPVTSNPTVHALASLLWFQASRLPARVDDNGNLLLLEEQDRSAWDRTRIRNAYAHLERAASGNDQTVYHLQAAIAAHHAGASTEVETDWGAILSLYDQLVALNPSPVVMLNRAVAVSRLRGPLDGLNALDEIRDHPAMQQYYLLPATRAALLTRAGRLESAADSYREALGCICSEPERRFLENRLAVVTSGSESRGSVPDRVDGPEQADPGARR